MGLLLILISMSFSQPFLDGYSFQITDTTNEITVYDYDKDEDICLVVVTYPDKEVCYTESGELTFYFED